MNTRSAYLVMAILGAAIPIGFFIEFFLVEGFDLIAFVAAVFVNGAAGGFTADLLLSSFVFWIYMFSQKEKGPKPWAFMAMNLFIGLSLALPAYLWVRSRADN